jgi:hypothetical protein
MGDPGGIGQGGGGGAATLMLTGLLRGGFSRNIKKIAYHPGYI